MDFSNFDLIQTIKTILEIKAVKVTLQIVLTVVIFTAILIILDKIIKHFIEKLVNKAKKNDVKKQLKTFQTVTLSIINTIICVLMVFGILNCLGIDVRPFLTAAGIVGVAVGFGAKAFIEDIISGLFLLFSGQIMVGDYVKIGDTFGIVEKINIKMVLVRDLSGALHYINNGTINKVINYTRGFAYAMFDLGVSYSEDIAHVIDVLKELGKEIKEKEEFKKKILSDIEIFGLDKFDSSSIVVKFRIKTMPAYQWEVSRAFNLMIKERFDKLEIEIPFNQVVVHTPQK